MKRVAVFALFLAAPVFASSTATWEMSSYADFIKGRFTGLSLTRDGRIMLAPKLDPVFVSEEPAVWTLAQGPDGSVFAATGHRGRVYRMDRTGKTALLWTAPQPEVFAIAVGPDGALYAGSSPDGKVYRIENGSAAEYFAPGARYIWSLAFGKDGALYVGTGDQGKIFRVTRAGQGELYYDTGQSHVTALAFDSENRLLAGSEPNGLLYRIAAKDSAFVLYDSNLPEIRGIVAGQDGAIYACALGGSVAQRTSPATSSGSTISGGVPLVTPGTTITVTDEAAAPGVEVKPKADAQKGAQASAVSSTITPVAAPVMDLMGVERSAIYRINADNTVETLWSSKEENAYDLAVADGQILFSTDSQGRIYRLNSDRRLTLVAQTGEGETTRLLLSGGALYAATSTLGKVFRLGSGTAASGVYESPVHDAGTVARWGAVTWRAQLPAPSGITFRTRSGNSARPDRTWSAWSDSLTNAAGSAIPSPNARFIQWKAEFTRVERAGSLENVVLAYLPQNTPPVVKSITVTTQGAMTVVTGKAAAQPAASGVYSITVTDTGDVTSAVSTGTPTQNVARPVSQQITVAWQAEDPDGDKLTYGLYFRGDGEQQWKLMRGNMSEAMLTLEGEVFADGKYVFRVVASDKGVNPAETARDSELASAPVLFDNTPPSVAIIASRRNGNAIELEVEARDTVSALRRAEYSLNATSWTPMNAADGIIDGLQERFRVTVPKVADGEHLVVVRVYDSSNNAGLAKTVVAPAP